jgi:hypothetical protein
MKKIFIYATAITFILNSCCEQIPGGLDLQSNGTAGAIKDTTYVLATPPIAQPRNVLVEESTGVRCKNCPPAAYAILQYQQANPGRIIVSKNHTGNLAIPIGPIDLRTPDATTIDNFLGGAAEGQPSASISREPNTVSGTKSFKFNSGKWLTLINAILAQNTNCNIELSKSIANNKVSLEATFTFADTSSQALSYCVYLTENKVVAPQDSVYVSGGFPVGVELEDYEHEEVLRKSITPAITGLPLSSGLQEKGRLYKKAITFDLPSNVAVPSNCHLVVFVQDANNRVIQVEEIGL